MKIYVFFFRNVDYSYLNEQCIISYLLIKAKIMLFDN